MQWGAQKAKISEKTMGLSNCYGDVICGAGDLCFETWVLGCRKWSISRGAYCSSKGSNIAQLGSCAIRVEILNLRHNSILYW